MATTRLCPASRALRPRATSGGLRRVEGEGHASRRSGAEARRLLGVVHGEDDDVGRGPASRSRSRRGRRGCPAAPRPSAASSTGTLIATRSSGWPASRSGPRRRSGVTTSCTVSGVATTRPTAASTLDRADPGRAGRASCATATSSATAVSGRPRRRGPSTTVGSPARPAGAGRRAADRDEDAPAPRARPRPNAASGCAAPGAAADRRATPPSPDRGATASRRAAPAGIRGGGRAARDRRGCVGTGRWPSRRARAPASARWRRAGCAVRCSTLVGEDAQHLVVGDGLAALDAGVVVGDHGDRREAHGELAGQGRLGHRRHADDAEPGLLVHERLGARGEPWPVDDDERAVGDDLELARAGRRRRRPGGRWGSRGRRTHVDDRALGLVDRVCPTPRAVDDLVGHDDGARTVLRA